MGKTSFKRESAFLDALAELHNGTRCTEPDGFVLGLDQDDLEETRERLIGAVLERAPESIYYSSDRREELLAVRLGRGEAERHYSIGYLDARRASALAGRTFTVILLGERLREVLANASSIRSRLTPHGRII